MSQSASSPTSVESVAMADVNGHVSDSASSGVYANQVEESGVRARAAAFELDHEDRITNSEAGLKVVGLQVNDVVGGIQALYVHIDEIRDRIRELDEKTTALIQIVEKL